MADFSSWTRSFGTQRGSRVRVYERTPGGMLYVSVWHPRQGEKRLSLGHRDKARAVYEAKELLKLRDPAPATPGSPSLNSRWGPCLTGTREKRCTTRTAL